MSVSGHRPVRRAHDYYLTPKWCVHRLLDEISIPLHPIRGAVNICDPAAGDAQLKKGFDSWDGALPPIHWWMNDIREEAAVPFHFDYLHPPEDLAYDRADITIMNPPYVEALRFIKRALCHSQTVYALLRLNWLASGKRQEFLSVYKPDLFVLPDRPSFDGQGSDASDYGWFRWPHQGTGITVLGRTEKKVRAEEAAETRRILSVDPRQLNLPHTQGER